MREEGFTLLEILIAITISGVLLLAVYMFMDQGLLTWEKTVDSSQWEQNYRILDRYLQDDLHNLFYSDLYKGNIFEGTNQSASWLVKKGDTIKEINYRVDYYSFTLVREEKNHQASSYPFFQNEPEEQASTSTADLLAFFREMDIFRIDFDYFDSRIGSWTYLWSLEEKGYLPTLFRITITREDGSMTNIISDIYIGQEYERGVSIYE